MIKAILFDVDGVIYDDNKELIYYQKKTAEVLGLRIPPDVEVFSHFGRSWSEMINKLWPEIEIEKYKKTWFEIASDKLDNPPLNKGVRKVLEQLKKKFKLGVVSGGHRDWILSRFKSDNLLNFFDVVVAGDDTEKHKPEAEPILYACKELNVKPEETVYVGDNIVDYEAAKNSRVNFIGFIWKGVDHKFFDNIKLKNTVEKFEDIPKEIEKI
jgi:HAD superfamily hydrolase (TIGR01549 family)